MDSVPKLVFIIPYRDREPHYIFFTRYIKFILEDYDKSEYNICFVHQNDFRPFNRGALKNIGFLYYKKQYPNDYKNIQFIFHDIDTIPYSKELWNYETKPGIVKHFYGFEFALGGIFTIFGSDFEKINGFPCLWSWGLEDNIIQKRVLSNNLRIDRSQFYPIQSKEVLHFFDGYERKVSVENFTRHKHYTDLDGLSTTINIEHENDEENQMLHVYNFNVFSDYNKEHFLDYDIKNGNKISHKSLLNQYNKNQNNLYKKTEGLFFTNKNELNKNKINKKSK